MLTKTTFAAVLIAVFAGVDLSQVLSHTAFARTVFSGARFDLDGDRSAGSTIPAAETAPRHNYPNLFNPATTISFTPAEKSAVKLSIFTIEGKRVVTLADGILPAGLKENRWNGLDAEGTRMSAGVYFYRLEVGKEVETRKMALLK